MEIILGKLIIILLSVAGFAVSLYIRKKKKESMSCLMGHDCRSVVNSRYNKFLGIPNEVMGMIYYGLIGAVYLVAIYYPLFQLAYMISIIGIVIAAAVILSVYLVFVQAFILKEFCTWCLVSAAISTAIFLLFFI